MPFVRSSLGAENMDLGSINWIGVDWGTTHLRAFAMSGTTIVAEATSDAGMAGLKPESFEPELLKLVHPWLQSKSIPVIACGMVGSKQGWKEAPYRSVPCSPMQPESLVSVQSSEPRLDVRIVPGLKQTAPADVVRGEEVQLAGLLVSQPNFDGIVCLPGTHSKWVRVSTGEVVGFQTTMTGELFGLLAHQSVLRHGMGCGWDEQAFSLGVKTGLAHADKLIARLFSVRAEGLLDGLSPDAAHSRLSGLLIGAELAAMKNWWLGQEVVLIGAKQLCANYASALHDQGLKPTIHDGTEMVLSGLHLAIRRDKV